MLVQFGNNWTACSPITYTNKNDIKISKYLRERNTLIEW